VLDINNLGDPKTGQDADQVWPMLRDELKSLGLLKSRISTDNRTEIQRHVRETMRDAAHRRLLVMLDEADDFLEADARENFRNVSDLRALMNDSAGRLKIVFAGLHSVQRFHAIPNQPLSHLGRPFCIGPLEPVAAHALVTEPLQHIGFRFDAPETVLRVLNCANYHPGLTQLFCDRLVARLDPVKSTGSPPCQVKRSDVEAVYNQIRTDIADRLDWTLRLDEHYQAIAWTLLLRQHDWAPSPDATTAIDHLLSLVRTAWPAGFEDMSRDRFKAYLDEMTGLGVLVRSPDGGYRFRTPNVMRLVGQPGEVEDRLRELAAGPRPDPSDLQGLRPMLDPAGGHYSALTHAEEARLDGRRPGVGLILASEALGLSELEPGFCRLVPKSNGTIAVPIGIPPTIPLSGVATWLDAWRHEHAEGAHLLAWRRLGASELAADDIAAVLADLAERVGGALSAKVVLVADPDAAWEWFRMPESRREEIQHRLDAVVTPSRWDRRGLLLRLEQAEIRASAAVSETILEATGGWPWLVDRWFDAFHVKEDAARSAAELHAAFWNDPSRRLEFLRALGVSGRPVVERMLDLMTDGSAFPPDLVRLALEEKGVVISDEECVAICEFLVQLRVFDRHANRDLTLDWTIRRALATR
jgi:hypothetical protein